MKLAIAEALKQIVTDLLKLNGIHFKIPILNTSIRVDIQLTRLGAENGNGMLFTKTLFSNPEKGRYNLTRQRVPM